MQHPEEGEDEDWIYSGQEEVPLTVQRVKIAENVIKIPDKAFYLHEELEEVILSSSVQVERRSWHSIKCQSLVRIGRFAFCSCESLSHVTIPQSVNSLATNAFTICSSLISIELPEERSFNIDLSGCLFLVSVVGQISIFFADEEDPDEIGPELFFQLSELGRLVDDEADLNHRLNHRFDNSPLNKLCYYQSYQSPKDAMAQLRSLMEEYLPLAATTQVDEFGMTPLHVLSLSQTFNLDMLQAGSYGSC
eukprot:scaffold910_cov64-Cylindrotheca_fusiformis.AAC.2